MTERPEDSMPNSRAASSQPCFQDAMPGNHCFGCGPENALGLRLKSSWDDQDPQLAVGRFEAEPHHCAGPTKFLNGGIIATLIDCHSVCTAVAHTYRQLGRKIGEGEDVFFATGRLEIDYKRPAPIDQPISLRAEVEIQTPQGIWIKCSLESADKLRAQGRVLAVQVPASWME